MLRKRDSGFISSFSICIVSNIVFVMFLAQYDFINISMRRVICKGNLKSSDSTDTGTGNGIGINKAIINEVLIISGIVKRNGIDKRIKSI